MDACVVNGIVFLEPEEYHILTDKWASFMLTSTDEIAHVTLLCGAKMQFLVSNIRTLEFWTQENRIEDAKLEKMFKKEDEQASWGD